MSVHFFAFRAGPRTPWTIEPGGVRRRRMTAFRTGARKGSGRPVGAVVRTLRSGLRRTPRTG
ncbi:hypothetical protein GCM10009665_80640 [Kitasatospora nipponensis]|uniref:Uncharacterized protein n=1 Tax=Kitasatospora nipponensis TaxID=258049 RepID=A0ABP4E610_9ACTN